MTQITSDVLLVSELFAMGRFTVPWHQRYYDWTTEQVGELLVDLNEAVDEDRSSYFLGSIMLVEANGIWEINDGQQRLITLSLLFASLCRRFAARRQSDAAREQLALRLLFDRGQTAVSNLGDTARDTPRIRPPRQDRSRFTQIIRGHDIGTNGKMTSAWNEIEIFVTALTQRAARQFFDFLANKVEIGVLYVPRTEDANAVFEALNGRGKQLTDVDLIRNHLYSYFSDPDDRERRATVHESLEAVLRLNRTAQRAQDYFRCYFQCRFGYLQKKRFYRETRDKIRRSRIGRHTGNSVYALVSDLADSRFVELFRTITATNPSREFLLSFTRASSTSNHKRNLPVLLGELRHYKVVHPLVFALLRAFVIAQGEHRRATARAVQRCLSDLASFVVRVSFCESKFEPSRFEATFANCANRVASNPSSSDIDIRSDLRECDERRIMDDARFASQLAEVELKDARRAKRLLFSINALQDREARALDVDGCTVEHVLPQSDSYWSGWDGFVDIGSEIGNWVHRIGNLTLLGDSDSFARRHFNASFDAKREVFAESPFAITRELALTDEWTPVQVDSRSRALARVAARVWAFSRPRAS